MQKTQQPQAASLEENIQAYEAQQEELEKYYMGKHVIFYNREKIGVFDTFDAAANEAIRRFGRGPYLIRKVGEKEIRVSSVHLSILAQTHATG